MRLQATTVTILKQSEAIWHLSFSQTSIVVLRKFRRGALKTFSLFPLIPDQNLVIFPDLISELTEKKTETRRPYPVALVCVNFKEGIDILEVIKLHFPRDE